VVAKEAAGVKAAVAVKVVVKGSNDPRALEPGLAMRVTSLAIRLVAKR